MSGTEDSAVPQEPTAPAAPVNTSRGMMTRLQRAGLEARFAEVAAGKTVWFARHSFHAEFADVKPKRHVFVSRTESTVPGRDWDFVYTALCGYTYTNIESLSHPILPNKTMPRIAERCKPCDRLRRMDLADKKIDQKKDATR